MNLVYKFNELDNSKVKEVGGKHAGILLCAPLPGETKDDIKHEFKDQKKRAK